MQNILADAREDIEKILGTGRKINSELIKTILKYRIFLAALKPKDIDLNALLEKLAAEFQEDENIDETSGMITVINESGKPTWLTASRKRHRPLWLRYKKWLEEKDNPWDKEDIDYLDESTDCILGQMGDPLTGEWDIRGLVVGDVQSGKTSNYTGLICKAADAGYKLIIVLAGTGKDLRKQTQMRLDEGFLGKATQKEEPIGVGMIDPLVSIPNSFTTSEIDGDFSANNKQAHSNVAPDKTVSSLFVVKKNSTILDNLAGWISTHKNSVKNLPMLIIDDEADNASVNNRAGQEDEVSAINQSIRRILASFNKCSYVGYTATPFANVLINPDENDDTLGKDIFPSDFIINLKAPANYFGLRLLFGPQDEPEKGLPLIRHIKDTKRWTEDGRISKEAIDRSGLLLSVKKAILEFLLACAVRNFRDGCQEHASMLIHVDRGIEIQKSIKRLVDKYIRRIRRKVEDGESGIKERFEEIYKDKETGFASILRRLQAMPECKEIKLHDEMPQFYRIWRQLPRVLKKLEIIMRNSDNEDILDYKKYKDEHNEQGMNVIVIGGNALSRGLTLEGLTVSYFLRDANYYDTILQMARWFGYRDGYLDLCRIYMTTDIEERYRWIATAIEELRKEFDMAARSDAKPEEYGFYIRNHPVIKITSRALNTGRDNKIIISYGGLLEQTHAFSNSRKTRKKNLGTLNGFVESLGDPVARGAIQKDFPNRKNWQGYLWENIDFKNILEFLQDYAYAPGFRRFNPGLIASYITRMANEHNELTNWTVAILGRRGGNGILKYDISNQLSINCRYLSGDRQTFLTEDKLEDIYTLRTVISEEDEAIDLSLKEWKEALKLSRKLYKEGKLKIKKVPEEPVGLAIRAIRGEHSPQKGLLLLYPLDIRDSVTEKIVDNECPFTAFAISFPVSQNAAYGNYTGTKRFIEKLFDNTSDE